MSIRTLLLPLLLLAGIQACKPMMYPLARAFGSPSEGELKKCRAAFDRLKTGQATLRLKLYPALDPVGHRKSGYPGTTAVQADLLAAKAWSHCSAADALPGVAATPLGSNQMRYSWNRARAYGAWVASAHPEGDFHLFTEVLSHPSGAVIGIHLYVVDASGQLAFQRLMNSHHFGGNVPADPLAAALRILRIFMRDIDRPADEVFPPYGVG